MADALGMEGMPATARDTVRTVYTYLEQHRTHTDYVMYKELRLPLGIGKNGTCYRQLHDPERKP
jgi:hypothetical protein